MRILQDGTYRQRSPEERDRRGRDRDMQAMGYHGRRYINGKGELQKETTEEYKTSAAAARRGRLRWGRTRRDAKQHQQRETGTTRIAEPRT